MAKEITLTLDEETIQQIETTAENLGKSKSQIVQEALARYWPIPDRLSEAERDRMLNALAEMRKRPPTRPQEEVQRELDEIRAARRGGGRRTPVD
jgi:predicted transcriptional regulator